jgi:Tfp pilus assembly protein PilN
VTGFETIAWIVGTNLGLASIATIFASAWVRVSRIDKLEAEIDKLWERITEVQILKTEVEACKQGITEIKELLKEYRNKDV